eukprot:4890514-Alexandrium_andersonii.AAC.1
MRQRRAVGHRSVGAPLASRRCGRGPHALDFARCAQKSLGSQRSRSSGTRTCSNRHAAGSVHRWAA